MVDHAVQQASPIGFPSIVWYLRINAVMKVWNMMAALLGLAKYLPSYWGTQNVRVSAVTLGGIYSDQKHIPRTLWGAYSAGSYGST